MKPGDKDAVLADLHAFRTLMRELGCGDQRTSYDEAGLSSDAPDDDSIGLVTVNIGERGSLSKQRVRTGARAWHETTQRYPQAALLIYVLGYDQDPRELWEIPESRPLCEMVGALCRHGRLRHCRSPRRLRLANARGRPVLGARSPRGVRGLR